MSSSDNSGEDNIIIDLNYPEKQMQSASVSLRSGIDQSPNDSARLENRGHNISSASHLSSTPHDPTSLMCSQKARGWWHSPKKLLRRFSGTAYQSSDTSDPITSHILRSRKDVSVEFHMENTCFDIEQALGKSYIDTSNNHMSSNALDVLALYIKGQKLLYTEAKTYCEQQLNFLMLPAIFISCVGSIFSFLSGKYSYGAVIIASLNGFNAFLLALISYLKLDAKAQAHKTSAYKFDKLESICEFNSGKFMFFAAKPEDILKVVERIESDVKEIKETNKFILPESIRYEFHFTYSTNIFTMVKRMQSLEIAELHNLTNCANKLKALTTQFNVAKNGEDAKTVSKITELILAEEAKRDKFIASVLKCRKEYYRLDKNFNLEIEMHMKRANKWMITRIFCCDWLKS
jgi:hypothetical protein